MASVDNPKKILFAGDPHNNFKPLISAVHQHQPEAVVLLGDYDLEEPLETVLSEITGKTEIHWIAGNHEFETPDKYRFLFESALAGKNLHLRVTEVAGVKIAGLGGIFLGRVWYPPRAPKWSSKQTYLLSQPAVNKRGLSLKYQLAIWPDEFHELARLKADILVTHEAPGSHRYGFSALNDLASAMGVKQVFHGHLHENYHSTVKKTIRVTGVANAAVADLDGNFL
jgi:predicted phosphodiesterase